MTKPPSKAREYTALMKGYLMRDLLQYGPVHVKDMAEKLETSERNIYRIVEVCSLAGPIYIENKMIYLLMDLKKWC